MTVSLPYFSVITPVFNGAHFIDSYISSLRSQDYTNWEAIIVDDGSTDDTFIRLSSISAVDPRFVVYSNKNHNSFPGPSDARNLALSLSSGLYICFLDIDDFWYPFKLSEQFKLLHDKPFVQLTYSTYYRLNSSTGVAKVRQNYPLFNPAFWSLFVNPVPMLTACVSRDLIKNKYFPNIHHEDYIFWASLLRDLKSKHVAPTSLPLAVYYIHPGSLSSNKLLVVSWIWDCYRYLGHNILFSLFALIVRAIIQLFLLIQSSFSPPMRININI